MLRTDAMPWNDHLLSECMWFRDYPSKHYVYTVITAN